MEGETDDPQVMKLRKKLIKNACAVLMCSRGTPMFLSGDEFCNTRFGNNNPYCQDNEISWLDWRNLEKNRDISMFFQYMIRFRKEHLAIRGSQYPAKIGFPFISVHGERPWHDEITQNSRFLGVLFAEYIPKKEQDDLVYLAINVYWEDIEIQLPPLPGNEKWRVCVNTSAETPDGCIPGKKSEATWLSGSFVMRPRSVVIFTV